jgi:hypothetical protein
MEFFKKNYEKVLLGLVLLGLAVAVAFLPFKIASERESLQELRNRYRQFPVQPLAALDLKPREALIERASTPIQVDFSEPHKLFNPMPWQMDKDNRLLPNTKVGPSVAVVTNISPLFFIVSLDRVATAPDVAPTYVFLAENQTTVPASRSKRQYYCKVGEDTKQLVSLIQTQGPPEAPSSLTIRLSDTGETAVVTKENPFKRVEGYKAALAYLPEKRVWNDLRLSNSVSFNFDRYEIVRIATNEVVLVAASNQKKWTIKYNPAP